jgi:TolA-binding protein
MSLRAPCLSLPLLLSLAPSCATTSSSVPARTPGARAAMSPPAVVAAPATDTEVLVLRERVTRLEKRLADVDARLGLLLARGAGAAVDRAPLRFDAARGEQRAVDLMVDASTRQPGDPLASIDIERGTRADGEGTDEPPIVEVDDAPASDDGEPVVLRLRGAPETGDRDGTEATSPATTADALYASGQAWLKESRHLDAIAAFEEIVARFPRDPLADNALYWLAFCHQAGNNHRRAIDVWQKVPLRFPRSDKIADALFGMAVSHEALGEPALAEALYDEVVHSYAKAERARDARKALLRLRPSR